MTKITFMGAGSTIFAKNVLGDVMLCDALHDSEIALYDIDKDRLEESYVLIDRLNQNVNEGRATVKKYLGVNIPAEEIKEICEKLGFYASLNEKEININEYLPEFSYNNKLNDDMVEYIELCLKRES